MFMDDFWKIFNKPLIDILFFVICLLSIYFINFAAGVRVGAIFMFLKSVKIIIDKRVGLQFGEGCSFKNNGYVINGIPAIVLGLIFLILSIILILYSEKFVALCGE
jgi:hypothetical protein